MKFGRILLLCLTTLFFLTACFALPVEDPVPPPPITRIIPVTPFRTAVVTKGDVVMSRTVSAFLVPMLEDRLMFTVDDVLIQSIAVEVGDTVSKGDVVAMLAWPEIQNRLEAALSRQLLYELDIDHVRMRRAMALESAIQSGIPVDDSSFLNEIQLLQQELVLIERELEYLLYMNDQRYLLATMDGTVQHVAMFTQGMTSNTMQTIAVIADQAYSVFEIRQTGVNEYMSIGEYFILTVGGEQHQVVVVDPEEFGIDRGRASLEHVYLVFSDGATELTGTQNSGSITLVLEHVIDVVRIPIRALNIVEDRNFVFVIEEDGARAIRDVVVGVRGNTTIEIVSGLYENEVIIDE